MLLQVHRRGHINTGPNGVYTVEYGVNITTDNTQTTQPIDVGLWTVSLTGRGVVRVQGPTTHTSHVTYDVDRYSGVVGTDIRERITSELELRFLRDLHHQAWWVIHEFRECGRWRDDNGTSYLTYGNSSGLDRYLSDPNPSLVGEVVR
jgi:hypothetical protein